MINIFEKSAKLIDKLYNPNKNYWETGTGIGWNHNVQIPESAKVVGDSPDADFYDEQELFMNTRASDIKRLLKYQ